MWEPRARGFAHPPPPPPFMASAPPPVPPPVGPPSFLPSVPPPSFLRAPPPPVPPPPLPVSAPTRFPDPPPCGSLVPEPPVDVASALRGRTRQLLLRKPESSRPRPPRWSVSLPQFRERLKKAAAQVVAAAERIGQIRQEAEEMGEEEWQRAVGEIDRLKEEAAAVAEAAADAGTVSEVARKLQSIKKRRTRLRSRRQQGQLAAAQWAARLAGIEQEAERWRETRREADLKREEERRRRAEARREAKERARRVRLRVEVEEKLEGLVLLRGLRRMEEESKGQLFSEADDAEFVQEIARLRMLLDSVKAEQEEEERATGVRQSEGDGVESKVEEMERMAELNASLFGEDREIGDPQVKSFLLQADESWEQFVQTRLSWDRFLCAPDLPGGSAMPPGWVLPAEPSSEDWQRLTREAGREGIGD